MQLIRLPVPDVPIYRIFPLWVLEEALGLHQLVFVPPSRWEDPFEVVGDAIGVDRPNQAQVIINQSLPPVFAQCWSMTAESDSLLRAYSRVVKDGHFRRNTCPRDEGVRVKSSVKKLLEALIAGTPTSRSGRWFVGAVEYLEMSAVLQQIANTIAAFGLQAYEDPNRRAQLLLLKRQAFSHESEVRFLFVQDKSEYRDALIRIPVDPSKTFDEISFDPRLETFERKEREAAVRALGYTGSITESSLYQRTLLQVALPA